MSEKIYNMVDLDTIEKLADLVEQKKLDEITIIDGEKTITIKGKKCPPPPHHGHDCPPLPPFHEEMSPRNGVATLPQHVSDASPVTAKPTTSQKAIKAPIVGTFYAAPAPDQKPFVQVGDTVKKGDVVLIIESMKLMNEVQSDEDGVVQEILVKNGDAVEYDQPLILLG